MALDQDIKRKLDMRLASGEISESEYVRLFQVLSTKTCESATKSQGDSSSFSSADGFVEIDKHTSIGENSIIHRSKEIPFEDIVSLRTLNSNQTTTANFVPVNFKESSFELVLRNGDKVSCSSMSMYFKTKKMKAVQAASEHLRTATFSNRLNRYLSELKQDGFIDVGNVRIYSGGSIVKGNLSLDLKTALKQRELKQGQLQRGTGYSRGFGMDTSSGYNPYEILVSYKPAGAILKKEIKFKPADVDVIWTIVEHLAKV